MTEGQALNMSSRGLGPAPAAAFPERAKFAPGSVLNLKVREASSATPFLCHCVRARAMNHEQSFHSFKASNFIAL